MSPISPMSPISMAGPASSYAPARAEQREAAELGDALAPVARLDCVTKSYDGVKALNTLSLTLRPGEIVALLGPNGAGKTTAIRLLLGLTRPDSGTAQLFGQNPQDRRARTRAGAMLQVGRMPESLRVREHIELFRGYYPRPLPMADILRIAGLAAIENKLFGSLSGGQKQRVLFALALAGDPDLLFLDEPTLGLDVEARRALWVQVQALAARGKTVLLTTHYLEEAEALATRIVLLKSGALLAEGTPAELRARAGSSRVRCRSRLSEGELLSVVGVKHAARHGEQWVMTTDAPEQSVRELLARDRELAGLEVSPMPFEDAFLSLTADSIASSSADSIADSITELIADPSGVSSSDSSGVSSSDSSGVSSSDSSGVLKASPPQ